MNKKITYQQFQQFKLKYFKDEKLKRIQRFGQAFMNQFFPNVSDPEVFHCVNAREAEKLILERYVTIEEV